MNTHKTLQFDYYYSKEHKCWYGYWMDQDRNLLGESQNAPTKELVLICLGMYRDTASKILHKDDNE